MDLAVKVAPAAVAAEAVKVVVVVAREVAAEAEVEVKAVVAVVAALLLVAVLLLVAAVVDQEGVYHVSFNPHNQPNLQATPHQTQIRPRQLTRISPSQLMMTTKLLH